MLTVICALGAAFCNASWAVMARLAGVAAPKGQSRWRTGWYLVHQPVWLVGQAFAVGVFVLSGVALYFGELCLFGGREWVEEQSECQGLLPSELRSWRQAPPELRRVVVLTVI
ncbi:MAG: hypothetical protein JOZ98_02820, partial [Solirubrobacterales bacterium]|nr:hypothetical protein [Solirubrobacterales bacterium]